MIRIDEFSTSSDIGIELSTTEQVRFLTFGFDIDLEDFIRSSYLRRIILPYELLFGGYRWH